MKSFDSLIGSAVRAAVRDDRRIRRTVSRIVPAEALAHVRFCRVAERQLRVTLDSAAWIPRLRFEERRLLAALAQEGHEVRTVRWLVSPLETPGGPSGRAPAPGSDADGDAAGADRTPSSGTRPDAPRTSGRGEPGADGRSRPGGDPSAVAPGEDRLAAQLRRMERHLRGRRRGDGDAG